MGFVILLLLIGLPLVEIYLFIEVGDQIGAGSTIALTVLTAFVGTLLVRAQGLSVLRRAEASVQRGEAPLKEALDGLSLLVAGVMLLIPGFFTDLIGGLLLIPLVREAIGVALLAKALVARAGPARPHGRYRDGRYRGGGATVEGDFENITPDEEPDRPYPRIEDR